MDARIEVGSDSSLHQAIQHQANIRLWFGCALELEHGIAARHTTPNGLEKRSGSVGVIGNSLHDHIGTGAFTIQLQAGLGHAKGQGHAGEEQHGRTQAYGQGAHFSPETTGLDNASTGMADKNVNDLY